MTLASEAGRGPVWAGNGLALVSAILWSRAFPATEFLLRGWDPLLLPVARLGGAAAFILLLAVLIGRARGLSHVPLRSVFLLGGFGVASARILGIISAALVAAGALLAPISARRQAAA